MHGDQASRIVILGGYGQAGRALTPLLLLHTNAHLVLAGRDAEKARRAAEEWNTRFEGGRVAGVRADAADPHSLEAAFAGAGMVVVAASAAQHVQTVAASALRCGLDYLDILYAPQKIPVLRAMAGDIERAGRCFITEAGFHPGLPSALIRHAASRLDRLDRAVAASVLNLEGGLPYASSVDELVESFRAYKPLVYRDGVWRALSMWNPYRRVQFGGGFGARYCVPLPLEEMLALPEMVPSLRETGFYIAGFNWFADWIVSPVVMAGLWLFPRAAVKPMGRLLCWSTRFFTRPPYGIVLQLEAEGIAAGASGRLDLFLFNQDGYVFTAVPVVACLLQVLDGTARRPGLHLMGHVVDPARLIADMRRMGIRIEEHQRG